METSTLWSVPCHIQLGTTEIVTSNLSHSLKFCVLITSRKSLHQHQLPASITSSRKEEIGAHITHQNQRLVGSNESSKSLWRAPKNERKMGERGINLALSNIHPQSCHFFLSLWDACSCSYQIYCIYKFTHNNANRIRYVVHG